MNTGAAGEVRHAVRAGLPHPSCATWAAAGSGCQGWPRATALARRAAAFTAWHRCCTLAPKEGWGWCCPRPCRLLGCAAMRKRAVTYIRRHKHHAGQRHNAPAPGWREPPRGADGPQPGAGPKARERLAHNGWAGANTTDSAQRLTRTPVVTAPAVTTHTNGCRACGLLLRLAEPQATRAGQGAQDITGVACSGATSRALAAAWGHATCDSPLC